MRESPALSVFKNGDQIKTLELQGTIILGRGEGCLLKLDDRAISRQHAVFRSLGEGVEVERKSEFSPLVVNGKVCERVLLKDGDVVSVGPYQIKLVINRVEAPRLAPEGPVEPVEQNLPSFEEGVVELPQADLVVADLPGVGRDSEKREVPNKDEEKSQAKSQETSEESPLEFDPNSQELPSIELGKSVAEPVESTPFNMGAFEVAESDGVTKVASSGKLNVILQFRPGDAKREEYLLTGEAVSIGRGKACDVVLNDKKCSRKNAIIRRAGLSFVIKDLGSSNGTFVNGAKITEQELSGDDVIQIGDVEFKFLVKDVDYSKQAFMPVDAPSQDDPNDPVQRHEQDAGAPELTSFIANSDTSAGSIGQALPPPGIAGISGMTGIAGVGGSKNQSLISKLKALPPTRRAITIVALLALFWLGMEELFPTPAPSRSPASKPAVTASPVPGMMTFDRLTSEQKKFVEMKHALAFDYFQNRDYDKCLYELENIFRLVSDYKDSREIERYAREGKRRLEALEEEKKRKEEEAKIKARVAELVDEIREYMDKKEYEKARDMFPQVLMIDPENEEVANWRRELEEWEEQRQLDEQKRQVREELLKNAWVVYAEAKAEYRAGKYRQTIKTLATILDIMSADKKLDRAAGRLLKRARGAIWARRDPVLREAREMEASGEVVKAYQLYRKATQIDPDHKEGFVGMARLRDILHERAKAVYTEAVMAESYSDFEMAKKKFVECLEISPYDDIYHERAERKLARYLRKNGATLE